MGNMSIISLNTQTSNSHIAEQASPFRQFAEGQARRIAKRQHEQLTYRVGNSNFSK